MRRIWLAPLATLALAGCAANPVTGKKELHLVSQEQEIAIGQQQYSPSRQAQGGDYVTDPAVLDYVREVGNKLAAVSDRKLPYEFVVVNDGTLNAWALPGGKIAVNRGLLTELHSEAELAAVLGHEIVHAAARHGAQQMEQSQLMQIGAQIASVAASVYGGGQLGQMVGQGAAIGSQLVTMKFGRDDELEADHYGMKYMKAAGYDLQAAVALQELFVRKFEEGKEQDWMTGLFASHPPSHERVAANKKTMKELGGQGGDLGADRYQARLANLFKAAPAYAKYDEAVAAAGKQDFASARKLADEAAKLVPREARFHALLGELEMANQNMKGAVPYFRKAAELDPGYFKPQVELGVASYKLGAKDEAAAALSRSMQLMPSAAGAYYLGRVYEDQGNTGEAVKLYELASTSKTQVGQEATARLAKLDLAQKPENYLAVQPQMDNQGRVWLTIGNRTNVPVANVSVLVAVVDQSGKPVHGPERVGTQQIAAGKAVNLQTKLGPFNSNEVLNQVRWKIESAQVAQ